MSCSRPVIGLEPPIPTLRYHSMGLGVPSESPTRPLTRIHPNLDSDRMGPPKGTGQSSKTVPQVSSFRSMGMLSGGKRTRGSCPIAVNSRLDQTPPIKNSTTNGSCHLVDHRISTQRSMRPNDLVDCCVRITEPRSVPVICEMTVRIAM